MPARKTIAVPPLAAPPRQPGTSRDIALGERLFAAHCSRCHANVDRSLVPDLRRMAPATHDAFEAIVLGGALTANGMGRFDDILSRSDAKAVHAYLIDQTRSAYLGSTQGKIPTRAN